jgi:hypothetical protein
MNRKENKIIFSVLQASEKGEEAPPLLSKRHVVYSLPTRIQDMNQGY